MLDIQSLNIVYIEDNVGILVRVIIQEEKTNRTSCSQHSFFVKKTKEWQSALVVENPFIGLSDNLSARGYSRQHPDTDNSLLIF